MVSDAYGYWIPPRMKKSARGYGSPIKMESDWIFVKNTDKITRSTQQFDEVENWEQAINDPIHTWVLHHRDEDQMKVSANWLKKIKQYYNLPPEKLIWMRGGDHKKLHNSYNCWDIQN